MSYLYLLQSENKKHRYLGSTSNVQNRLHEHNNGTTISTRNKRPWFLLQSWECPSLLHARQIEYKLKRMKKKLTVEYITYFVNKEFYSSE